MQRVWIIGASGSGKTTLGKLIAQKLEIPAVDLDDLNWLPDWQTVTTEQLISKVEIATSGEAWIVSGNYTATQRYLERADTLIWLDYPFLLVLIQLLKRTSRRLISHETCCNGNVETWKMTFSHESIILWLFRTYKKRKAAAIETINSPQNAHLRVLHFRRPRQTANWLQSLQREESAISK